MSFGAALQNGLVFAIPVLVYAVFVRWRVGLSWAEIAHRLGLRRGRLRPALFAVVACIPAGILGVLVSARTKNFEGSMLAPFLDVSPNLSVLVSVLSYGLLATGFPEELLFRGLIGGALFRRLSFGKANVVQAFVFTLPHLLILLVAPDLWALAVILPMALGLLLGWIRHAAGSIGGAVLVHAVSNMSGALWVLDWGR